MITLTISVKRITKALGYTVAIYGGAWILATIIWAVTGNPDLWTWSFWGGLFLGILAVLTDEMKKREGQVPQPSQEGPAALLPPSPTVHILSAPEVHQVSTHTIVDLTCGVFDLRVTRCTDVEHSGSMPGQYSRVRQES